MLLFLNVFDLFYNRGIERSTNLPLVISLTVQILISVNVDIPHLSILILFNILFRRLISCSHHKHCLPVIIAVSWISQCTVSPYYYSTIHLLYFVRSHLPFCFFFSCLSLTGRGGLQPQLDSAMQDVSDMYLLMEETEKQAVRRALLEERGRYCTFISFLQPVVVSLVNTLWRNHDLMARWLGWM